MRGAQSPSNSRAAAPGSGAPREETPSVLSQERVSISPSSVALSQPCWGQRTKTELSLLLGLMPMPKGDPDSVLVSRS